MAGKATSDNEVAAKMIGMKLQSLLKIPPIKKEAEPKHLGGEKAKPAEEKENLRKNSMSSDPPPPVPTADSVPRDRFGRPFQSLDKRGRGPRDFHNGPKRFGGPPQRDTHLGESREPDVQPGNHVNPPPQFPKGRIAPPRHVPASGPPVIKPSPPATSNAQGDRFAQARKPAAPPLTPYELPPRFTEDNPKPKERVVDPVDPSVRQLARKPECPIDIKENIDEFHDSNINPDAKYLAILKKHCIFFLIKKSPKFPRAKYYCMCCNYHMDNIYATINHILQERHYSTEKMFNVERTVSFIPTEHTPEHMAYLTDLIIKTSKLHGINNTEKKQRMDIVHRINEALKDSNLDYEATLFGSSLPGFGLRESNVNININVSLEMPPLSPEAAGDQPSFPKNTVAANPAEFMEISSKLLLLIKGLHHIRDNSVKEACTTKCISIHFEEEVSRASCIVHYNNSSAVLAAQLFLEYDQLDERVKQLVTCFRYWAKLCDIDDPEKGFLPPHCYTIMVLHFLIRRKQILPNLHLLPRVKSDRLFATAEEAKRNWTSGCDSNESVGELWIDLLRYFALEFCYKTHMISITRDDTTIPKTEKQWNRRLCIEDPIIPKSNLSRIVTNNKICDYIIDRIKLAYIYFGIPRRSSGPLYCGIFNQATVDLGEIFSVVMEGSKPTSSETLQRMVRQIQKGGRGTGDDWDASQNMANPEKEIRMAKICWGKHAQNYVHCEDVRKMENMLFKREYCYEFKQDNFTDGLPPPVICKACGVEGHLKSNCPEETIPPFSPVEYPTPLTLARLNKAIYNVYDREALDRHDVNIRTRIVNEVRDILFPVFPAVCLTLFGSTFNGFGLHASDVDICLTFNDIVVPPDQRGIKLVDAPNVLEKIVNALKVSGKMTEILSIPSAKVPIVKFRHIGSKLEGDISLYNRLSIYNTELLRLYVDIDSRVAQLGLFLKKLVKLCDVGDASKGSLSSYSYILMLIHFLQNHSVPVLPVLQELHVPGSQSFVDYQCDNHHVKYSQDLKRIVQVWDGYGKNKESVSQLWLAFLNYYVEHFDTDKHVITISQEAPLTRVAKSWFTDAIAIEDPFDKTHNLGLGLSRRMSVHIIRTMQKCRTFFHRSTDHLRNEVNFTDFYMDVRNVRDGNPPIDRQCRLCNRIGHFARSCTYVNKPDDGGGKRMDEEEAQQIIPLANFDDLRYELNALPNGPKKEVNVNYIGIDHGREPEKISSRHSSPEKGSWRPIAKPNLSQNMKLSDPSAGTRGVAPFMPNGSNMPEGFSPKQLKFPTPVNASLPSKVEHVEVAIEMGIPFKNINRENDAMVEQNDAKPVKEVIFFGDIGNTNTDGEQIQAMLQKNQGVTFAFGQRQADAPSFDNGPPVELLENPAMGNMMGQVQPPPGFCPPGTMYLANGPPTNNVSYVPDQGPRPVLPNPQSQPFNLPPIGMPAPTPPPSAHWHNQVGMPMRFQQVIPVGVVPFDGRQQQVNGDNAERPTPPIAANTAPPPGFAPLPSVTNSVQPPEMIRSYPTPLAGAPPMGMYSVAPVGMGYQATNSYTSTPSAPVTEAMEPVVGYRQLNAVEPTAPHSSMNYDGPLIPAGQGHNLMQAHMSNQLNHHVPGITPHQHAFPVNAGMPNGQLDNGEEALHLSNYPKATIAPGPGEMMYNTDYGASNSFVAPGNPPVASYGHGLSLSQAHHGPVVSALQMQHSQHHPMQMQGGHYHQVRSYMPLGAFPPSSPYSYPQVHVPHEQSMQHLSDQRIGVHGGDQIVPPIQLDLKSYEHK